MADPKHPRHYDEAFKRQIVQSCDRPRGAGSKASATAAPPGPRTTARPSRTSRSGRGDATGGWRWRWTFKNKRRRYSHEGRRDTSQRGEAREPAGPRVRRLRPAHASGERPDIREGRERMGVRVPAGRSDEQGHRRPFRRADPGRGPDAGRIRHPRLPADGRPGVPHRPGQRVRQHED